MTTALHLTGRSTNLTVDKRNLGYVGEPILTELSVAILTEAGDQLLTEGGALFEGLHLRGRQMSLSLSARE